MSEVCETSGGTRVLNMEKLDKLLDDPRIKDSPDLTKAVLNAANQVNLRAIRKIQSNIVWDLKIDKTKKRDWDSKSNELGSENEAHLDLDGIYEIAEQAGVDLKGQDLTTDQRILGFLNDLLIKHEKLKTVLSHS